MGAALSRRVPLTVENKKLPQLPDLASSRDDWKK
jgi:hypothetical protein